MIESQFVKLLDGKVAMTNVPTESGKGQDIARCPVCMIGLWSHYSGLGDRISFVRVGTLADPDLVPPDIHIFTNSKQPWMILPDDISSVPGYYNRNKYWPKESLVRYKMLMN